MREDGTIKKQLFHVTRLKWANNEDKPAKPKGIGKDRWDDTLKNVTEHLTLPHSNKGGCMAFFIENCLEGKVFGRCVRLLDDQGWLSKKFVDEHKVLGKWEPMEQNKALRPPKQDS